MNTNPTRQEVVDHRDEYLVAREEVLDRYFVLEDLLANSADFAPEDVQAIHAGLAEVDNTLKHINDRLAEMQALLQVFEDRTAEPALMQPKQPLIRTEHVIAAGFFVVVLVACLLI